MASKKGRKSKHVTATLVTDNRAACAICQHNVDDETLYGKQYAIGDIQCHYYCVLLSCCLVQKGKDEEGLFGFLYPDILAEIERSKKHRCSYCSKGGATLGCTVAACRKQFHLPCGRNRSAVSLFFGNYKSFCQNHAPKQKIPEAIMCKARERMRRKKAKPSILTGVEGDEDPECVCVICYEAVSGFPTPQTFWPPCCARDKWFHRSCLERMSLNAGLYFLKCPLCNDKEQFYRAVVEQGYYVPDRDASWELEQDAFGDMYRRPVECRLGACHCTAGRRHDGDGEWDIYLCLLCGASGAHRGCLLYGNEVNDDNDSSGSDGNSVSVSNSGSHGSSGSESSGREGNNVSEGSGSSDNSGHKGNSVSDGDSGSEGSGREGNSVSVEGKDVSNTVDVENGATGSDTAVDAASTIVVSPVATQCGVPAARVTVRRGASEVVRFLCAVCRPAAKNDLLELISNEPAPTLEPTSSSPSGPPMPSRMSLRRTKPRPANRPDRHPIRPSRIYIEQPQAQTSTTTSNSSETESMKFNLSTTDNQSTKQKVIVSITLSPTKMVEQTFYQRMRRLGVKEMGIDCNSVLESARDRLKKPRPLSEKRKVIDDILNKILEDVYKNSTKLKTTDVVSNIEEITTTTDNQASEESNEEDAFDEKDVDNSLQNEIEDSSSNIDDDHDYTKAELEMSFESVSSSDKDTNKTKTVDIEMDSSLEISKNDNIVNVDIMKIDDDSEEDHNYPKDVLEQTTKEEIVEVSNEVHTDNVDQKDNGIENSYLQEVANGGCQCKFSHKYKHIKSNSNHSDRIRTAIDFAIEAYNKENERKNRPGHKRKLEDESNDRSKRRKRTKTRDKERSRKRRKKKDSSVEKDKGREFKSPKDADSNREKVKKKKKKSREKVRLKIKWRADEFKLKITKTKKKHKESKERRSADVESPKVFKQYVLKSSPESSKTIFTKPEKDVTPVKRKYVKQEKSPTDNLKQMNIQNYFLKFMQ